MSNRTQLKKIIEDFGYDEGLEKILVRGVVSLPETTVTSLLGNLDTYRATINNSLEKMDCLIAQEKKRPATLPQAAKRRRKVTSLNERSSQVEVKRHSKTIPSSVASDTSDESTSSMPIETKHLPTLLDISSVYISAMSSWINIWSAYFDNTKYSSSAESKTQTTQPPGTDIAVAAVRSAIAAANSAFENMRKAASQMTDLTQDSVKAATKASFKAPKKTSKK